MVLVLAGCASTPADESSSSTTAPAPEHNKWTFSLANHTGFIGIRVEIHGPSDSQCGLSGGWTQQFAPGVLQWFSRIGDDIFAFGSYVAAQNRVHVGGPVQYENGPAPAPGDVYSEATVRPWNITLKGDDTLVIFFDHLVPPRFPSLPVKESLWLQIECPKGHAVRTTGIAHEAMPFVLSNLNGTVSLSPYVRGPVQANVFGEVSVEHDFTAPEVYFRFSSFSFYDVGRARLETPGEDALWVSTAEGGLRYGEIASGPTGHYNFTVSDVGDGLDMWGLALGFEPPQ